MDNGTKLQELFDIFVEQLLEEVKASKEAGIPIAAADKAAIIRFLQINDVTYKPSDNDELTQLRESLMQKRENGAKNALTALRDANADLETLYGGTVQ